MNTTKPMEKGIPPDWNENYRGSVAPTYGLGFIAACRDENSKFDKDIIKLVSNMNFPLLDMQRFQYTKSICGGRMWRWEIKNRCLAFSLP